MFERLKQIFSREKKRVSYSQCGEDLIIEYIFNWLGIHTVSYIDIGAYNPTELSNTFLFYRKGGRGVCIEPDPTLYALIKRKRPKDVCLNIGVGSSEATKADFYMMTAKSLNTFSKEVAQRYESYGIHRIERVLQIPILPVNDVIRQYCSASPNLVSLDAEGLDLEILRSFDTDVLRPEVFCVETLTYTQDNSEAKVKEIVDLMKTKGYFIYADTYINTIFVSQKAWQERPRDGVLPSSAP